MVYLYSIKATEHKLTTKIDITWSSSIIGWQNTKIKWKIVENLYENIGGNLFILLLGIFYL